MLLTAGLIIIRSVIVPVIFIDYELRKEFIIKNYCINKNRPELHCDGKCYLAKRIEAAREKEEKQASDSFSCKLFGFENFVSPRIASTEFELACLFFTASDNFEYASTYTSLVHPSLFVPPRA